MSQKCSTPARLQSLIRQHTMNIENISDILRTKAHVALENQADFVKEHGAEYFEGQAAGMNAMLESALMEAHCYAGFHYFGEKKIHRDGEGNVSTSYESVGPDHPQFREWRRFYYTRP
jgi:hypothetical protein